MTREHIKASKRFKVLNRDSFTCQYCGKKSPDAKLEIDHIKPVSKGGDNSMENLITSCFDCNRGKRDTFLTSSKRFGNLSDFGKIKISEAACSIGITKQQARYWLSLLFVEPERTKDNVFLITETTLKKLKKMELLVRGGKQPQVAAAIANEENTLPEPRQVAESPRAPENCNKTMPLRQDLLDILSAMCFAQGHDLSCEIARVLRNEFRKEEAQRFFGEGLKNRVDDLYAAIQEQRQEL